MKRSLQLFALTKLFKDVRHTSVMNYSAETPQGMVSMKSIYVLDICLTHFQTLWKSSIKKGQIF